MHLWRKIDVVDTQNDVPQSNAQTSFGVQGPVIILSMAWKTRDDQVVLNGFQTQPNRGLRVGMIAKRDGECIVGSRSVSKRETRHVLPYGTLNVFPR